MSNSRAAVLDIFHAALAAVHGAARVQRFLAARPLQGEVRVVAVGKAAGAMLEGARRALGERLNSALLITKPDHVPPGMESLAEVTVMEAGHPLPDARSLQAGRALL